MAKKNRQQELGANEKERTELPPGVKLLRTLEGHQGKVSSVAFDSQGETLASASDDRAVKLWDVRSGKLLRTLEMHDKRNDVLFNVVFDSQGETERVNDFETARC